MSFWQELKTPIVGLSPMDGVTDEPMRYISATYGQPTVIFTEFVNVDYFVASPLKLSARFWYSDKERPIVAQLSGIDPQLFYQLAFVVAELGFDGLDINMGCPARSLTHRGGGAALIGQQKLAQEIVLTVDQALNDWQGGRQLTKVLSKKMLVAINKIKEANFKRGVKIKKIRPALSIKTRSGRWENETDQDWLQFLSTLPIKALTVHGRSLSQGHSGPVNWEFLSSQAPLFKKKGIIFLGNGGVDSLSRAQAVSRDYQLDGVLIGQAACGNPWVFSGQEPTPQERIEVMLAHANYYCLLNQDFLPLRKHLAWYATGFAGARKMRADLVGTSCLDDLKAVLAKYNFY